MQFAINYSPQAAELVDRGLIDADLFKCPTASDSVVRENRPALLDEARAVRPIYIHFPIDCVDISSVDWSEVDRALDATETKYVNVHLAATNGHFPDIDPASMHLADADTITDAFVRGVSEVVRRYGAEQVIAENVVYWGPTGRFLRAGIEPAVINRVIEETGCGLLLDLAHARLTCHTLGTDPRDYLSSLPVQSLKELHVTGTGDIDKPRDSMPMNDLDWFLYVWACSRITSGDWRAPWVVAFEYGGIGPLFDWRSEPDVIQTQWPQLRSIMQSGS